MHLRFRWSPWLQVLVAIVAGAAGAHAAQLSAADGHAPTRFIEPLGKGAVPLDGAWQFHLGDNPAWAAADLDDSVQGGWERLTADQGWGAQGHYDYVGFAWYRCRLSIAPGPGTPPDLALLVPAVEDAYEIYWNGRLIGKNGKLPPQPKWYLAQPARTYGIGPAQSGVLAFRVWKAPLASNDPGELGGFEAPPVLGTPEAIAAVKAEIDYKWLRSHQLDFALNALYGLIAILSLMAWLRDRNQWLLFWMAGYTITQPLGVMLTGLLIPWTFGVAIGVLQPLLMLQDISLWYVLLLLLKLDENRAIVRLTRVCAVIFAIAFSLDGLVTLEWASPWTGFLQIADAILTVIFTPLELLPLVLVVAAVVQRKHLDSVRWLVAGCAFVTEMIFVVRNAASQGVRFTHWTLADTLNVRLFVFNGNPVTSRVLANTILLLSIVYAVLRYSIEARRQQDVLEQEFKNARELQQVLVPEHLPALPGFALTSAYRPAQEVGGDFFQIIPIENGSTLVVLGDVSGKGLKAAMAVSLIVGAVRTLVELSTSPAEILSGLNRRLYGRMQGGFVTAVALRLNANGSCVIATAGHPAPFLNRHEMELPGALPLGLVSHATYEESTFQFSVGDHFALYTDGLLEARSQSGELYGFDRLETLFATNPNAEQATEAAVNFGQDDDITVLTLTRLATGQESTATHVAPILVPA